MRNLLRLPRYQSMNFQHATAMEGLKLKKSPFSETFSRTCVESFRTQYVHDLERPDERVLCVQTADDMCTNISMDANNTTVSSYAR